MTAVRQFYVFLQSTDGNLLSDVWCVVVV